MKKGIVTLRSHHKADNAISLDDRYERYFNVGPVYFRDYFNYAFIGQRRYRLNHPTFLQNDVLMVSFEDVRAIFAQTFTFELNSDSILMEHNGIRAILQVDTDTKIIKNNEEIVLEDEQLKRFDNILWIPLEGIMRHGFEMYADWQKSYLAPGDYLGLSDHDDLFPDVMYVRQLAINADKSIGNLSECYFYEEADSLMPYRLYIPSGYDPSVPSKMLVYLHGATPKTNPDHDIDKTGGKFEQICDRYNYILLACDGYAEGFYGGRNLINDFTDVTPEEMHYLHLCENEVLSSIKHVESMYNIDRQNVFLMGNSMGGGGTLWIGNKYHSLFRAIVPCGCLTGQDPYQFDFSGLKGMPTLLVCGTENIGYAGMKECTRKCNEIGMDAQLLTVGGGYHENAWIIGLPEIFTFLEEHSK